MTEKENGLQTPLRKIPLWSFLQIAVFAIGVFIVSMLLIKPVLGLFLLWDVLIPVAPLLLLIAPGIWRNVCPMATFSMLPHKFNFSMDKTLSRKWQGRFLIIAILLLMMIVPLRHVVLDKYGLITGIVLLFVAVAAFILGLVFDRKSGWCSGLCPVYPVEMLYGSRPLLRVSNKQCRTCTNCVTPCRDAKKGITPADASRIKSVRIAALMFVGCFPGFVLGWYLVPPSTSSTLGPAILESYLWTYSSAIGSLLVFVILYQVYGNTNNWLARMYAASAISVYYWFKLPGMLGLSGDTSHALISLAGMVPDISIWILRACSITFFIYFLMARPITKGWTTIPQLEKGDFLRAK